MGDYSIKISAKGSRKSGREFIKETQYLSTLVDCLEIDFNYPHDGNFKTEIAALKRLRRERGLNFTVHAQYLNGSLNDFNKKIRRETLRQTNQAIDYAVQLGAAVVTLHPALEPYGLKSARRKELELQAYAEISNYAVKKKIKIGLENEAQTCFWFPDRACKIELVIKTIKQINKPNFGLTLDIGHANVSGEDYLKAIKKYHSQILHLHAHDNFGRVANNLKRFNRPDPHLAPGQGKINWPAVIELLRKIKFKGYLELECEVEQMAEAVGYIKSL